MVGHGRRVLRLLVVMGCALLTLALTAAGARAETLRWTRIYNGPASGFDAGLGVATAADGGPYVVGATAVTGQGVDLLLQKYSASGTRLWTKTYNGDANGIDVGTGVAVARGSVYVTGCTAVAGRGMMLLLRKYSSTGAVRWTRTRSGLASDDIYCGYGVAVAPDGMVYVVGFDSGKAAGNPVSLVLLSYSETGRELWTKTYQGPTTRGAAGYGVSVGEGGNVYVTGATIGYSPGESLLLRKYSPTGKPLWTKIFRGTGNGDAVGRGIATTPDGSIFVAGSVQTPGGEWSLLLQRYAANGTRVWTRDSKGLASTYAQGHGVAVGAQGSVYVTGTRSVFGQMSDILLQKYSATGALRWSKAYNGAANGRDSGSGVAAAGDGSVYVVGETSFAGEDIDLILRKYK